MGRAAVTSRPAGGRRDQVLAAVVFVAAAVEAIARPDLSWRPVVLGLGGVFAAATLMRRTRVFAAVAVAFGAFLVVDLAAAALDAEPVVLYTGWIVLVLVQSLFRWGSGRDIALGAVLVVVEYAVAVVTDSSGPGDALVGAAVLLSAAALGVAARYRAVAREQLVEQAKLQERELLARELHDTVAHHVSAIATQAQAGLVLARSVPAGGATEALEVIDREAARALAEMRTMVGALRDARGSAPPVPRHRLADIEALAASGAGSVQVDVQLCGDLAELAPSPESALYRVAQESVTNTRRHAHDATRVAITVTGNAADSSSTTDRVQAAARQPTRQPEPIPASLKSRRPAETSNPGWPTPTTVADHLAEECRASPDGGQPPPQRPVREFPHSVKNLNALGRRRLSSLRCGPRRRFAVLEPGRITLFGEGQRRPRWCARASRSDTSPGGMQPCPCSGFLSPSVTLPGSSTG